MKVDGQNDTLRARNPETYNDLKSFFRAGNFQMPMGLSSLYKLEELTSVQVNVSGYHKKDLFPIRTNSRKILSNRIITCQAPCR